MAEAGGGIADTAASMFGISTGSSTGTSTGAPAGAAASSSAPSFLSKGIGLPWWSQIFITGIFPLLILVPYVGPTLFNFFYTFGVNGINLLATNSMTWAVAKAAFNLSCQAMAEMIASESTGQWWLPAVKAILYYANPWFVFDIIQVYNPNFRTEGFKIPFANIQTDSSLKPGSTTALKDSDIGYTVDPSGVKIAYNRTVDSKGVQKEGYTTTYGKMSTIPIAASIALLLPAMYTMSAFFPPELQAKVKPVLDTIMTVGGGITAIAGGGIGSFVLLPKLIGSVQDGITGLMTGGAPPSSQTGGGIPSVHDVAKSMLRPASTKEDDESKFFLGVLAFTIFGGLSLAVIRKKGVSGSSV
jgi:hypothetical protein